MKTQLMAFGAILFSIAFYLSIIGLVVSLALLVIVQDAFMFIPVGVFVLIVSLFFIALRIKPALKKSVGIFFENNSAF